ncbi:MAG TPA: IclR family transcriptional regulator [Solirubrobacteraceae bacterium]|nr:IclR family transcriptional regulator [Solirubrobacteraceae bacterium]
MRKQVSANESSVGTLARGLDVLGLFAEHAELTQKQISDLLGLPMPTVHRLTALLTERGWLDRDQATRRLRLGLEMVRLVPAMMAGMRLPELARPHLLRLASSVQETVNVAILQGAEIIYLLSETGDRLLTSQTSVGMRLPAHCTALGKCLLAQLAPESARAALGPEPYERRTERTLTTWAQLAASLEESRRTGVTVSEEEYEVGLVSIAVPVRWVEGPGTAAINVSLPSTRATPEFRARLAHGLLDAAREIDAAMALPRTGA